MTLAPNEAATSGVRSVELLSTTITSSTKSGIACRTFSMPCSSFRQGMMTVMDCPLYMRSGGWRYHGSNEAFAVPLKLLLCAALRRGPRRRALRVCSADGTRTRPVSGQPLDERAYLPGGHRPETGRCRFYGPHRRIVPDADGCHVSSAAFREARQSGTEGRERCEGHERCEE